MDYVAAVRYLKKSDPQMAALIKAVGPCGIVVKDKTQPWQALTRAVAYQQLHGRAAESIFNRFLALYAHGKFPTPDEILESDNHVLRAAGFSQAKVNAIRDIAEHAAAGKIPTRAKCAKMSDEEIIAACVPVRGVGRWLASPWLRDLGRLSYSWYLLLIFTLGRLDVWPVDDFGIAEGYRHIYGLKERPKAKELKALGDKWAPYRSVAAWYLWRAAGMAKEKKDLAKE